MPSKLTGKTRSFDNFPFKKAQIKAAPKREEEVIEQHIKLPVNLIVPGSNIRKEYSEAAITGLAESMKKHGQLQPIRVYDEGDIYIVIFGHRRLLAARQANIMEMDCIITRKPDSLSMLYTQIIENEQSQELSAQNREDYIKLLLDNGQSYEDVARNIGKSESWVRHCAVAFNTREKFRDILDSAPFSLGTEEVIPYGMQQRRM